MSATHQSISKAAIRAAMRRELENCRDPRTGEINCTKLAENVACELNIYENTRDYTIPEYVFELAAEFT